VALLERGVQFRVCWKSILCQAWAAA
jgi:hypothetical protein